MELATIDSHSRKELTEIHRITNFGVNQASFHWDTAISKRQNLQTNVWQSGRCPTRRPDAIHTFLDQATIFYTMFYYCTSLACSRRVLLVMTSLTYRSKFVHFSAIFSQSFTAYLEGYSFKLWAMTTCNVNKWELNSYQRFLKAFLVVIGQQN